ncbi:MAG: enoyl-CoA hydratase/isomerase family protein [Acetobacteraceae bacterium]|nr:enoyl-CoA hydratase/isomerase family protein [Acetobacteraceae bacterium]
MTEELLFEVADGIGRITFNRPAQRNALTWAMYDGLVEAVGRADRDDGVRALVITGAGEKAFAAGTDIGQFREFRTPADAIGYEERIERVLNVLENCRVPTIAAIAGACTGGGAAIAACCDLRIAAAGARFGFPIAKTLGNCLSMTNLARLSALIGAARVKEVIFTARLIEADEAQRIGLVSEVVAPEALAGRADALAQTVAGLAPLTLRATKRALHKLRPDIVEDEELILMCYQSADFREGMDAFLAKRPPVWQGA